MKPATHLNKKIQKNTTDKISAMVRAFIVCLHCRLMFDEKSLIFKEIEFCNKRRELFTKKIIKYINTFHFILSDTGRFIIIKDNLIDIPLVRNVVFFDGLKYVNFGVDFNYSHKSFLNKAGFVLENIRSKILEREKIKNTLSCDQNIL